MLSVSQLLTPMTAAQVRANAVTMLQALGLQPQNWAPGGIASSVLTVACTIIAALSVLLSNAIAQQWNPTAFGAGLILLAQYVYGVTPPKATFASGSVTLTNTGGGVYSYGTGQVTFASTVANAAGLFPTYTNTAPFTLNAGTPTSPTIISVPIQCTTIGTAGNAAPGFVTQLVTALRGVACTNPAAILGIDALSDPALRQLNINSLGVRGSNFGPRAAYAYAIQTALNAVTGLPVNVNRWSISIASHTGQVTIYVASPTGTVVTTDLEGISNNIEQLARPDGITVLPGLPGFPSAPASATTVNYGPAITCYIFAPSVGASLTSFSASPPTPAQLQAAIALAISTWFAGPNNPIGGLTAADDAGSQTGIFESGIVGIIGQAVAQFPNCFLLSTVFSGTKDLPLTTGQVAIWTGTVAVQVQSGSS